MNSIKNFLNKTVLMAVATASLVTVAGISGNNVANAKEYSLNTNLNLNTAEGQSWDSDNFVKYTLANKNSSPSTMPVIQNNGGAFNRNPSKQMYFLGIPVTVGNDGAISIQSGNYIGTLDPWLKYESTHLDFYKTHPEFVLLTNRTFDQYKYSNKFVNIKKLYHDYYHVNIDKILTYTRPANWRTKYFKHGLNPKTYMVKGYTANDLYKMYKFNHPTNLDSKLKNLHNIVYKDQRFTSNKLDFGTATKY